MADSWVARSLRTPRRCLTVGFLAWKALVLALARRSSYPGYDTSATLLAGIGSSSVRPLVRWDALYFIESARRGLVFEQEWAFSWTLTRGMGVVAKCRWLAWQRSCANASDLPYIGISAAVAPAWAGVLIAHASHYIAILLLHRLSRIIFGRGHGETRALIAAGLHIISPAGIFLSAPNAESPFALFHFLGVWLYVESSLCRDNPKSDLLLLLSGAAIGLATALRSNGLFSGFYFAYDAIAGVILIVQDGWSWMRVQRLAVIVISGCLVALGFILPQTVAYRAYCTSPSLDPRPWCRATPPSIYTFVQEHYWNNGFLRYWTISNLPLFLLAAPILSIMMVSSVWSLESSNFGSKIQGSGRKDKNASSRESKQGSLDLLHILAAPQALVALYTLTSGHVQIATRLSSGYPLWYLWIADMLVNEVTGPTSTSWVAPQRIMRWMVMYALIQAGLYSSFLPPA